MSARRVELRASAVPSRQIAVDLDIPGFDRWLAALEERHLADLRFSDVTRALRALSSSYVERRGNTSSRALDGAGKRAAFAMFYAPLHLMLVHAIVRSLDAPGPSDVLDIGCGTGVAAVAWAFTTSPPARVTGIDLHPWTLAEANWTYRTFGLRGTSRRGDIAHLRVPPATDAIISAYTVNELADETRAGLLPRLLGAAEQGVRVLIIEPIATSIVPWWPEWRDAFEAKSGRADEWRFRMPLPALIRRLDKAAGLRHDELTARSLYCRC
jgi:SAM-dependent methyltransferase